MGFYIRIDDICPGSMGVQALRKKGLVYDGPPWERPKSKHFFDPGRSILLELSSDGSWQQSPPYHPEWTLLLPESAGTWYRAMADEVYICGQNKKDKYFLLRSFEQNQGHANFGGIYHGSWDGSARWTRTSKPLPESGNIGMWVGLAGKGGAALVVGAEGVLCYVIPIHSPKSNGFGFVFYSGRLGANVGASGNAAFVMVMGVQSPQDIDGFVQSGTDWNLSLGGKWSAFKNIAIIGKLEGVGEIIKGVQKNADALAGAGKAIYQAGTFDWEERGVSVIDLPAGGGLEAGLYWYVGRCAVLGEWKKK